MFIQVKVVGRRDLQSQVYLFCLYFIFIVSFGVLVYFLLRCILFYYYVDILIMQICFQIVLNMYIIYLLDYNSFGNWKFVFSIYQCIIQSYFRVRRWGGIQGGDGSRVGLGRGVGYFGVYFFLGLSLVILRLRGGRDLEQYLGG